jgi:hypothetical protein
MNDLNIPDAAYDAWIGEVALSGYPLADGDFLNAASAGLVAAVPLVVAAELRRIADTFEATAREWREEDGRSVRSSALGHAVRVLRARADELDPAGGLR